MCAVERNYSCKDEDNREETVSKDVMCTEAKLSTHYGYYETERTRQHKRREKTHNEVFRR